MSFCQLRLATERPKSVLKNGSSKRCACESAIHHQLDRVDIRGLVRREEKHGLGNFFRLAPTALRNRRREELRQLSGIFCGSRGAGPALPNGSFDRAWRNNVHANVARCEVGGDGTRHRDETALGGCIRGDARLAEIVMYRPTKDDATVVVQQRRRCIHREESGIKGGVDYVLKNGLVARARRSPAGDAGIGEDNVELPEICGQGGEEPLAIFRTGDVSAVATRARSKFGNRFIERHLARAGNGDLRASPDESSGCGKNDATVAAGKKALFRSELHNASFL